MKTQKNFGLTIFHLVGLLLAGAATLLSYYLSKEWTSFLYIGVYGAFLLLSLAQKCIMRKPAFMPLATFLYNLFLFIKTIGVFCIFLLPGTFGDIHSDEALDVVLSILLFALVLFAILNIFLEQIHLNGIVRAYNEEPIVLNTILPKPISWLACYFPLLYQFVLLATIVAYILGMGFLGPIWLLITFVVYGIFAVLGGCALNGESKMKSVVGYGLSAIVKNAFVGIMLYTSGRSLDMNDTRVFFTAYELLKDASEILLLVSILVDVLILICLLIGKGKRRKR